jgi:hypothetical protein
MGTKDMKRNILEKKESSAIPGREQFATKDRHHQSQNSAPQYEEQDACDDPNALPSSRPFLNS